MTKLASQMTSFDYEQFALTEKVNPNRWQVLAARAVGSDMLISIGYYDAGGWPTPFDVIEMPRTTNQSWEELWRDAIEWCDHENEKRGAA